MKTCYQCDKEVQWLTPDSRCGDCTHLTPEQVQGIDPMPREVEEELDKLYKKFNLTHTDDGEEEGVDVINGEVNGRYVQLNICDAGDHVGYELFVEFSSKVFKNTHTDKEVINFINEAYKVLNEL